jgi:cis-3-alkyl-4-acyloxetan-2-one decarboxylase
VTAPDWEHLYPFEGRSIDVAGQRMHLLDEGSGPPVVMLHGNPTWSFYYRELVQELRSDHRCIVPDHVGCGLSDKPSQADYPYSLERRVSDLEALLDALEVRGDVTLVVHDWGGMIGMAWATRHPERVARLVVLNTAAFRLPEGKPLPWQLRIVRNTPLGPLLVQGLNAFSRGTVKDCVTRKPLDEATRQGYLAPYDSWGNRAAVYHFVKTIPLSPSDPGYDIVLATERGLAALHGKPMLVCWGMQDFVFDGDFLADWESRFPEAEVHRFEDSGHLVLEDARDEILALVRAFIARHPLGVEA